MQITSIEKVQNAGFSIWTGEAQHGGKRLKWYYWPRHWLHVHEQDVTVPQAWMNIDPPDGATKAVQQAIRRSRR